jgi:hypothetical protein
MKTRLIVFDPVVNCYVYSNVKDLIDDHDNGVTDPPDAATLPTVGPGTDADYADFCPPRRELKWEDMVIDNFATPREWVEVMEAFAARHGISYVLPDLSPELDAFFKEAPRQRGESRLLLRSIDVVTGARTHAAISKSMLDART